MAPVTIFSLASLFYLGPKNERLDASIELYAIKKAIFDALFATLWFGRVFNTSVFFFAPFPGGGIALGRVQETD